MNLYLSLYFHFNALPSLVQGYWHQCSIPANGMNLVIFNLVNIVMALIIISAMFTLVWYIRSVMVVMVVLVDKMMETLMIVVLVDKMMETSIVNFVADHHDG